jgi:YidC/Oxa1 family membrane protein insertase
LEKRTLLALFLTVVILFVFQVFLAPKQSPQPQQQPAPSAAQPSQTGEKGTPAASAPAAIPAAQSPAAASISDAVAKGRMISVETRSFTVTFNEIGGGITSVRLKDYKEKVKGATGQELIKNIGPDYAYLPTVFQETGAGRITDIVRFVPDRDSFTVLDKPQAIAFAGTLSNGSKIKKIYTLQPEGYTLGLKIEVEGATVGKTFVDFAVISTKEKTSGIFKGPFTYNGNKLNQIDKVDKPVDAGETYTYTGFDDGFFAFMWIPGQEKKGPLTILAGANDVPVERIALTGQNITGNLFFGPKKVDVLTQLKIGAQKIVDFGWFDVLAKPMLWGLNFANRVTHNYGIDIILLTILIKIIFYPLSVKSYKSMKEMQKLQPLIAKLKEKYKDDKAKLNTEMMDIYKQKKVNPLGGCLPMVIQIPVFFALYKVLMGAIEFRHAPFFLWINDLAAPENLYSFSVAGFTVPLRVLPFIMGITMLMQQKMTPTSVDPIQEKMMLFMPVVFTFLFWSFPSGLVLYWLVNNVISIAQQYYINQKVS